MAASGLTPFLPPPPLSPPPPAPPRPPPPPHHHVLRPLHDCMHLGTLKNDIRGQPFMTSTRRGEGVRLRWTHVDGGGGPAPCGRPHRKLKLESTDVILSSSH